MFVGILLLLLGALMMLDQLGIIRGDAWDYIMPIALIALGGSMIFKDRKNPSC